MKRAISLLLTIFLLACAFIWEAGCGSKERVERISLLELKAPNLFSLYYPVISSAQPSLLPYRIEPDLSNVTMPEDPGLSPEGRAILVQNGFVGIGGREGDLSQVYKGSNAPAFITLDCLLHAFHLLSSYTLRDLEKKVFFHDLERITHYMLETSCAMRKASRGKVKDAAERNQAFFAVAGKLLDPGISVPSEVEGLVEEELRLINGHAGPAVSPLFGYTEDYSKYMPPGDYAGDEELEGCHRAVTWYSRMRFRLRPGDSAEMQEKGRRETRQALLIVGGLHAAGSSEDSVLSIWERLFQCVDFLMGGAPDLDIYDYTTLMENVFGRQFELSRLEDDGLVDLFIEKALQLPQSPFIPPAIRDHEPQPRGFSLLKGGSFPDEYIFEHLVENQVPGRKLPRGLDIPAVMGSSRAREIVEQYYDGGSYPGYPDQLERLSREFACLGTQQAYRNLQWGILFILRSSLLQPVKGYPSFMLGPAWQDRSLYSFLGAWSESRHGVGLQVTEKKETSSTTKSREGFPGYVEPCTEALGRFASLVGMMEEGLEERGLLSGEVKERLDILHGLLLSLVRITEKELRGEAFSSEEMEVLRNFPETLEYLSSFPAEEDTFAGLEWRLPLVVDAYSDSNNDSVLQEAVGYPIIYHVIVPYQGKLYYARGAGFSYYETVQPARERLTDEGWLRKLTGGEAPQPPFWTTSFLR
jgi:hypothetical protein